MKVCVFGWLLCMYGCTIKPHGDRNTNTGYRRPLLSRSQLFLLKKNKKKLYPPFTYPHICAFIESEVWMYLTIVSQMFHHEEANSVLIVHHEKRSIQPDQWAKHLRDVYGKCSGNWVISYTVDALGGLIIIFVNFELGLWLHSNGFFFPLQISHSVKTISTPNSLRHCFLWMKEGSPPLHSEDSIIWMDLYGLFCTHDGDFLKTMTIFV